MGDKVIRTVYAVEFLTDRDDWQQGNDHYFGGWYRWDQFDTIDSINALIDLINWHVTCIAGHYGTWSAKLVHGENYRIVQHVTTSRVID